MPELPEVETLCRQLQEKITGKVVAAAKIYDDKLLPIKGLKGKKIITVRRRGKTIEIVFDDGRSLLIHLRMTGRLLWQEKQNRPQHSRWKMTFADGSIFLVDPRRFATVKIAATKDYLLRNDPLLDFDRADFLNKHGKRQVKIKNLIMDQRAVAGIGNIYACEIMHRSCIDPQRRAADLQEADWDRVFKNARNVLIKAIYKRGTSISDWRDLYGRKGENQNELKVYGREGKICANCGGVISRVKQGGRSTFYCSRCQH